MHKILDRLIDTLQNGKEAVLCAIVRNHGSAPRTSGARMLFLADGAAWGSVGGGAVEGACWAKAVELLQGSPSFAELHFELNGESAAEEGMICGGRISVLLHRVGVESLPVFQGLRDGYLRGDRPVLLTMMPQGELPPRLIACRAGTDDDVPAELRAEILGKNRRKPYLTQLQGREVFVEPLVHPGRIHLVGAGHVSQAVAGLADFVGFEVVVMDDRREFASAARFPKAYEVRVLESFNNCIGELGPDDYVIIVTRGHLHDREVLAQALKTSAGYIGMIGSRSKRAATYDSMRHAGFSDTDLTRAYCPIGLAIGADTPEEIALSIVAQLVQVRAGKKE